MTAIANDKIDERLMPMEIPLDDLRQRAKDRPVGYVDRVLSMAIKITATHYTLTTSAMKQLRAEFAPMDDGSDERSPRAAWPVSARLLAKLARPGDAGLGDTAERLAAKMGGAWFKSAYKLLMGHECGCRNRREKLNARYSLKSDENGSNQRDE